MGKVGKKQKERLGDAPKAIPPMPAMKVKQPYKPLPKFKGACKNC